MQTTTMDEFVKDSNKDIIISLIKLNNGHLSIDDLDNFDLTKSNVDELVNNGTIKEISKDVYEIIHE